MKVARMLQDAPERRVGAGVLKSPYMQKVPGPSGPGTSIRPKTKSSNRNVSWHTTFSKIGGKDDLSEVLISIGDTTKMAGGGGDA